VITEVQVKAALDRLEPELWPVLKWLVSSSVHRPDTSKVNGTR
jgi:hypothetical protein